MAYYKNKNIRFCFNLICKCGISSDGFIYSGEKNKEIICPCGTMYKVELKQSGEKGIGRFIKAVVTIEKEPLYLTFNVTPLIAHNNLHGEFNLNLDLPVKLT